MSIVVAVKKNGRTALASDRGEYFGSLKQFGDNVCCTKIQRIGSSLLGQTGWGVYDCILEEFLGGKRPPSLKDRASIYRFFLKLWEALREGRYGFVNDQCDDDDTPFANLDASFIVANKHGIFRVGSNLGVVECKKYWAIGSGSDFAFGALHCLYDRRIDHRRIAEEAVRAAIHFDTHCGGEVELAEVR